MVLRVFYLLFYSGLLSGICIALEFCLDLGKLYLGLIFFYYLGYIIKDCFMPLCMEKVFTKSLVGCILLSGFQLVQLLLWVFVGINLGVLLGGHFVKVSGLILQ